MKSTPPNPPEPSGAKETAAQIVTFSTQAIIEKIKEIAQCSNEEATQLFNYAREHGEFVHNNIRFELTRENVAKNREAWRNAFSQDLVKFKKDNQNIFIETGTGNGDGVSAALEAGFTKVYSIELNPTLSERAALAFKDDPVEIITGSSCEELPKLFKKLGYPVGKQDQYIAASRPLFLWLDAHWSGGLHIGEKMGSYLPKELAAIAACNLDFEDHSILIDDMNHYKDEKDFITLIEILLRTIKKNASPQLYDSLTEHTFMKAL